MGNPADLDTRSLGPTSLGRNMAEPTLTDLKRSFLVQLADYQRLEAQLISAEQINKMTDPEVESVTTNLMESLNDLNELHDRIETLQIADELRIAQEMDEGIR